MRIGPPGAHMGGASAVGAGLPSLTPSSLDWPPPRRFKVLPRLTRFVLPRPAVARRRFLPILAVAGLALALGGCRSPQPTPETAPPSLPEPALALLEPDTVRARRLGDGVWYRFVWSGRGPWAVHLVSAETGRCDVGLSVVPATSSGEGSRRPMKVSEMAPAPPAEALAGVNGDFFMREAGGLPVGSEVTLTTRRFSDRPALAWSSRGVPWIGSPSRSGDGLVAFGPDTLAADGSAGSRGVQVVGGYPELLDQGRRVGDLVVGGRPGFASSRHPRTAVGFDPDAGVLWLVVVDGRQAPWSDGMSLPELADLFVSLGASEALNLDGGGSSTMTLGGRVANRPSDLSGERRVGNSLWVVRDPTACGGSLPA